MKTRAKDKKYIIAVMSLGMFLIVHPAQAYVWPTIDLTQIANFVNKVTTQVNKITTLTAEINNATKTIQSVGDQVTAVAKFPGDLRDTIALVRQTVEGVVQDAMDVMDMTESTLDELNEYIESATNKAEETANNTVNSVEDQVDSGTPEDEVQDTIDSAKEEIEENLQEANKTFDNASDSVSNSTNDAVDALNGLINVLNNNDVLTEDEKNTYIKETEELKERTEGFKEDALQIINDAKENYNEEYSQKIAAGFDEYSQAVADYYAGNITREELTAAGEKFKDSVSSFEGGIEQDVIDNLVKTAQDIANDAETLTEEILDKISNDLDYSDDDELDNGKTNLKQNPLEPSTKLEDEPVRLEKISSAYDKEGKYIFNFMSSKRSILTDAIYLGANDEVKKFIMSKELACQGLSPEDIEKKPDEFRKCVTRAKTEKEYFCPGSDTDCDPFKMEEALYGKFRKNGVYKHMLEDYSVADIVNNDRIMQYARSWNDVGDKKSTIIVLKEALSNIDNASDAYSIMSMIDLESPRLWSQIRSVDALHRGKEVIQRFQNGETLSLDGRDDDFRAAIQSNPGIMKVDTPNGKVDKAIFANVFLYNCGIKADDISVAPEDRYEAEKVEKAEKTISDCLFKYAEASSKGTIEGSPIYPGNYEQGIKEWIEKGVKTLNDSSFETLTLATVNNYKSSKDYEPASGDDLTIANLQENIQNATTTRDDYAAGAQINYYASQQILSIIDADAQVLQTDILKDLSTFGYNYFDKTTGAEE